MIEHYPVLKDAEPFYYEGNEIGILVLHGFTGTTQSMRPLGQAYHEAGYTVCGPRLKGHGTHYEDMEQTTYHDWIASVEEGYQWLKERCETIFVTGLSMGGTLTLYLAEKHPEIKGIILVNAAIENQELEAGASSSDLPRYLDAIGSDLKNPEATELAYEKTPTASINEIVKLMGEVRDNLSEITCPALLFFSKEDHVVPPDNASYIFDRLASSEKSVVQLDNSYHVATLDYDQPLIIEQSLAFFEQYKD